MNDCVNTVLKLCTKNTTFLKTLRSYGRAGQWAIGAKGGTLGIGGELTKKVATDINTRAGFNMLDFSFDDDVAGIEYDFDMDALEFYPVLSAGLYIRF